MATIFRATVMLTVLVGLPSAWVYYGPLPPEAMGVIQRTVASAKHTLGWDDSVQEFGQPSTKPSQSPKTAPRFDPLIADATHVLQQESAASLVGNISPVAHPVINDPQFSLASANVPATAPQTPNSEVDQQLSRQLEPHLTLLRSLNAAEYTLENWGGAGQLYRFRCAVSIGTTDDHTRQFEAIDADPVSAVREVVGEVTAWQNARHLNTTTRWQ